MRPRRGVSRSDVIAAIVVVILAGAVLVPALGGGGIRERATVSMGNLRALAAMHDCYAADWNDRQYTAIPDDFGSYGTSDVQACANFQAVNGYELPPMILGWGCVDSDCSRPCDDQGLWGFWAIACSNVGIYQPLDFEDAFGSFRLPNAWPLHDYLSGGEQRGRFYDQRYYAPDDAPAYETVEPLFGRECEFIAGVDGGPVWSSYAMSPAAMFAPDVFRSVTRGGFQDPFLLDEGFRSPSVSQVTYSDLKSRMIEHNWLRNAPGPCNPALEGCVPYQFNHGADARPLTLAYDGSVMAVRSGDVEADDRRLRAESPNLGGDGLWSRDTPLGARGYLGSFSADGTLVSHHVLTTDGIRGRDRLSPGGQAESSGQGARR